MCIKIFEVHYCKPYPYNENKFLPRVKTFYDWSKAHSFMIKKENETGFHCTLVELALTSSGVYNIG